MPDLLLLVRVRVFCGEGDGRGEEGRGGARRSPKTFDSRPLAIYCACTKK